MKKTGTTIGWFTAFLCVALLWGSPALAVDYNFEIAGTKVTDANCNDLSKIVGVAVEKSGWFVYDPTTNTLKMKDVTVSPASQKIAILNFREGLKIEIAGTNYLKNDYTSLACIASTEIKGDGYLFIEDSHKYSSIFVNGATLTISGISLESGDIKGNKDGNQSLIFKNARVKIKVPPPVDAIWNFDSFTTQDCEIISPKGAYLDATRRAVRDADGELANEIVIERNKYDLYIAGTQVTKDNCNDLSKIPGVTVATGGEFKYDPATKKLTMKDVKVQIGNAKNAIYNKGIEGLKIVVSGKNSLEATDYPSLAMQVSTFIEGSGDLKIISASAGIVIAENTLTISDITLEASGKFGIAGWDGTKNETLILKNAKVTAKGSAKGIADLASLEIKDCEIVEPADGKFDETKHAVVDAEGNVAKEVKIEPAAAVKYELYIAGTQVTDANCNNLKDIKGVTVAPDGEFKYDPASNTLHMKDVTVSVKHVVKNAIYNKGVKDLKIVVSGTNRLESNIVVLYAAASIEIKGRGSLTVINNSNANIGIYLASSNTTVTISDISLEVSGKWGISGEPSVTNQALILKNARITASGTEAAIEDVTSFTTEGCEIVEPAGGKFDKTKHAVVDAEENKAKEVKIEPAAVKYELYIAGTQVTVDNCNNLKDITGVTVAEGGKFKYDPSTTTLTMKDVKESAGREWEECHFQ